MTQNALPDMVHQDRYRSPTKPLQAHLGNVLLLTGVLPPALPHSQSTHTTPAAAPRALVKAHSCAYNSALTLAASSLTWVLPPACLTPTPPPGAAGSPLSFTPLRPGTDNCCWNRHVLSPISRRSLHGTGPYVRCPTCVGPLQVWGTHGSMVGGGTLLDYTRQYVRCQEPRARKGQQPGDAKGQANINITWIR